MKATIKVLKAIEMNRSENHFILYPPNNGSPNAIDRQLQDSNATILQEIPILF